MLLYGSHWGHARAEGGVGEHTEAFETQEGARNGLWGQVRGQASPAACNWMLFFCLLLPPYEHVAWTL